MRLTALELVRRKFVPAATIATLALILATSWGFWHLSHSTHLNLVQQRTITAVLSILMAYLFSFVIGFAAIALAAPTISNDVDNGTLLPILARPISRPAIVFAKTLALALISAAYAALSVLGEFAGINFVSGYWPPHPFLAAFFLALLAAVMVVLGVALSTRMSTIAASITGVGAFGVAWIGGIAGSIGQALGNTTLLHAGTLSALLLPSDAMWRFAVYDLQPVALVAGFSQHPGNWPGPFFVTAPEPASLFVWTCAWLVGVGAIGAGSFSARDI
ncbi:MAG: ABC transporter permease [Candidatus Eremiobacteraeota bacterium]|nr:ABC transporter permease [Candidatus Eremiobacteraeota bacterium]